MRSIPEPSSTDAADGGRTISSACLTLAVEALYEVGHVSRFLREHIEQQDASGQVKPLARGMLSRVEALSDAIAEYIGEVDEWDDDQLRQIVVEGDSREVSHA